MFVVGLLLGPALGLAARRAAGPLGLEVRLAVVGLALFLAILLVIPAVPIELRLGTVMGACLGILLACTPYLDNRVEQG